MLGTWPMMPPLDPVFIRNVPIYLGQETKRQILGPIRGLMRPDAYLFLGAAETTLNDDDNFARHALDHTGVYRLQTRNAAMAA